MIVKGIPSKEALEAVLSAEGLVKYQGNVRVHCVKQLNNAGTRFSFRLGVNDTKRPGFRRGHSGRKVSAACWHVHRDYLLALFTQHPGAVVSTCCARYTGLAGFRAVYPSTAYANIGSIAQPLQRADACDCDADIVKI